MRVWMIGAALLVMGGVAYAGDDDLSNCPEMGQGGAGQAGTYGTESNIGQSQGGQGYTELGPCPSEKEKHKGTGGAGKGGGGMMGQPDLKGVTVNVGGGVEGYTGKFGANINPGPAWNVVVEGKPFKAAGIEVGYSGAANDIDHDRFGSSQGAVNGADIVRNGGHAALILQAPTAIAPYVLGGIGLDRYNFRGVNGQFGFRDDTSGSVPVGVGVRGTAGHLNADLRMKYDWPFGDNFSPVTSNVVSTGRYAGTLQIGGTF